jgi:iron-sulfur cluster assembly protein
MAQYNESDTSSPKPTADVFAGEAITVTPRAVQRLQAVMAGEQKTGYGLRLSVVGGGCSGLSYQMTFDNQAREFDKVFTSNGLTIYCDLKSWLYLKGVEIDYSDDILNGGFKINNPNAARTCGCGTSFSA